MRYLSWILFELLGAVAVGFWLGRRRYRRGASAPMADAAPTRERIVTPRLTAAVIQTEEMPGPSGADTLAGQLALIARDLGAVVAMLWQRRSSDAPFVCVATSGGTLVDPPAWGTDRQRQLAAWAATEDIVTFDATDKAPSFVAAPARPALVGDASDDASGGGVLVIQFGGEAARPHAELKALVAMHAAQLSAVWSLGAHGEDLGRQNWQLRALVRTALDLQAAGDRVTLEESLTERALDVTGASYAVLVQWDRARTSGIVRRVTRAHPDPAPEAGATVTVESIVASACIDGTPQVWEDATSLAGRRLFGGVRDVASGGSIAVLPLRRGMHSIGALVVGSMEQGALAPRSLRTARMFAQLAASSLEAAWELEEANVQSQTDPLTGLWNRRRFNDTMSRVLNETDRFGGSCGLIMCDIDLFKAVNDTHGHEAGDEILKSVAAALLEKVRTTDLCARIGGEELCVVLPQTSPQGSLELAERLRAAVERSAVAWKGKELRVTASFGVASYMAGGGDNEKKRLFEAADAALYKAKRNGRNRVEVAP